MFLSSRQQHGLANIIRTLAEPLSEREIRARLGEQVLDLLDAQFYASYVWDPAASAFGNRIHINMDTSNLLMYERYFQYHDPITLKLQQFRRAVHVNEVMPQRELMRTEFFVDFLGKDGLHWGMNLYAWDADVNIGDMRIWRDRKHENFTTDDRDLLDLIRPAFVTALARCRHLGEHRDDEPTSGEAAPALSALSERQQEVARLVSCGLHDKEIARRLGISVTTVRSHLDCIFRKLNLQGRARLAHWLEEHLRKPAR